MNDMNLSLKLSFVQNHCRILTHSEGQEAHICLLDTLLWVGTMSPQKICWSPNLFNMRMTLIGNKVLIDVTKLKWGYVGLWWALTQRLLSF